MAIAKQRRARVVFAIPPELFAPRFGNMLQHGASKHSEPLAQSVHRIIELGKAIKELRRVDREARGIKLMRVGGDGRVIPGMLQSQAQSTARGLRSGDHLRAVPVAAELHHQASTGPQMKKAAVQRGAGFTNPVEHRIRKDGIEVPLGEIKRARVRLVERDLRISRTRLFQHAGRRVEPGDFRAASRDLRGELPGAAAEIENALARLRAEQRQQSFAILKNEAMLTGVELGIPLSHQPMIAYSESVRELLWLVAATPTLACSCGAFPSPKDAWLATPLVFVGQVTKVDPRPSSNPIADLSVPQTVWLRVEEPFKGVTAGESVQLNQQAGGCWGKLRPGERALLYVHASERRATWEARPCFRTRRLDRVADDLLFLRALPRSAQGSRLSGTIGYDWTLPPQSLAGIPVRISASGLSFELKTDAQGVFEIYGLPPGEYLVEPIAPQGLKVQAPAVSGVEPAQRRGKRTIVLRKDAGVSLEFSIFAELQARLNGEARND